ncbi:uncharacterized protein isoform X2 [Leptinotarsa decemlineata]|uniref:uncharacterized protein isoform X2 n=1 Tax=Leptinotarsa decemlineata TaxID=7539 RepID=UPI000C2546E2|nr:uncharacterized protein LOC111502777 isoform X2 [Leptinotarsa decemlineata]
MKVAPRTCECTPSLVSSRYTIPINEIAELVKLDQLLGENVEEEKKFMKNMVQVGGKNVQVCTYRILEKLLTSEISMQMNWSGKNPNKFAVTNLKHLVRCVVKSVCLTVNCTEEDVETYIKNYLRTAKDRLRIKNKPPKMVEVENSRKQPGIMLSH